MMIKEIIVVEGRDDEIAVKRAVDADVVLTHGYSYGKKFINKLKRYSKERGIIVFTDPDFVGKRIRRDITRQIPEAKHAFIEINKATKGTDIGIENASDEDIITALKKAKPQYEEYVEEYTKIDLMNYGLYGSKNSKDLRRQVADILGIEYGNSKAFLRYLNSFKITREELEAALEEINK